jgi:hypothetical protein
VTTEQVRNLALTAGVFEKGRAIGPVVMSPSGKITRQETLVRSNRSIGLEIPEELELGQTYTLLVSSDNLSLSARLVKQEIATPPREEEKPYEAEFLRRLQERGKAIIREEFREIDLASSGAFSGYSRSDLVAQSMRRVIAACQELHPGIRVPDDTSHFGSPSDLDTLSAEELQAHFEMSFEKDKAFESERMQAAKEGNEVKMNKILKEELSNSQLLINLAEALQRKGIEPKIPECA